MCENVVLAAAFYSNPVKARELWNSPVTNRTQQTLPRLLYLPMEVAAFVIEKPRTPWDVHTFVSHLVIREQNPIPEDCVQLILRWLRGVSQMETGKTVPAWTLEVQPVVSADQVFAEWCFHHVQSTIRDSTPMASTTRQEGQTATLLTSIQKMVAVVEKLTSVEGTVSESTKSAKPTPYSEYTMAVLKEYSRICNAMHLSHIWLLFQTTKEMEDRRLNLQQRMTMWAHQEGIKIDSGVFFSKDIIKDIVEPRPNPSEGYALLRMAEKGVSILACLSQTLTDSEAMWIWECAAEESKTNQTLSSSLQQLDEAQQPMHLS